MQNLQLTQAHPSPIYCARSWWPWFEKEEKKKKAIYSHMWSICSIYFFLIKKRWVRWYWCHWWLLSSFLPQFNHTRQTHTVFYWIINLSQVPAPTTTTTTVWTTTAALFQYLKTWKENIYCKSVITVWMSLAKMHNPKARAMECSSLGGGGSPNSSMWELEISAHSVWVFPDCTKDERTTNMAACQSDSGCWGHFFP